MSYGRLVQHWIANQYTLRYSGGLVPDVYHVLIKGEGVLANASSLKSKAKLRLLYECAPISFIVEAAGGASCFSPSEIDLMNKSSTAEPLLSVLEVPVSDLDRRIGLCCGSLEEVQRFHSFMSGN